MVYIVYGPTSCVVVFPQTSHLILILTFGLLYPIFTRGSRIILLIPVHRNRMIRNGSILYVSLSIGLAYLHSEDICF